MRLLIPPWPVLHTEMSSKARPTLLHQVFLAVKGRSSSSRRPRGRPSPAARRPRPHKHTRKLTSPRNAWRAMLISRVEAPTRSWQDLSITRTCDLAATATVLPGCYASPPTLLHQLAHAASLKRRAAEQPNCYHCMDHGKSSGAQPEKVEKLAVHINRFGPNTAPLGLARGFRPCRGSWAAPAAWRPGGDDARMLNFRNTSSNPITRTSNVRHLRGQQLLPQLSSQ